MHLKKAVWIGVLGAALTGCIRSEIDPTLVNIELTMVEVLTAQGSFLQLFLETEEEFECGNYNLAIDLSDSLAGVSIVVQGVEKFRTCLEVSSTATNTVLLPSEETTQTFRLTQQNRVSTGVLRVTDTRYFLDLNQQEGLNVLNNELIKIPENLYWGVVRKATNTGDDEYDEFTDVLESRGANFAPELLEGAYSFFEVEEGGVFTIPNVVLNNNDEFVVFEYPNGSQDLDRQVNNFTLTDFTVEFFSFDGFSFVNRL